ncbi:MAG: DUF4177 domain-containing protein [Acidimicrobiales bacterium]
MWEYKVVRRFVKGSDSVEFSIEKALNSYAQDGWEFSHVIRDESPIGRADFLLVFRGMSEVAEPQETSRPVPPSRRVQQDTEE